MNEDHRRVFIVRYFSKLRRLSDTRLLIRAALESTALAIVAGLLLRGIGSATGWDLFAGQPRLQQESLRFLFLGCCAAPMIETVMGQWFPVMVARWLKLSLWWQIFASCGVFAALHFTNSVGSGLSAGLIGGLYLGFVYAHFRERSLGHAFWKTAFVHAAHNFGVFLIALSVAKLNLASPSTPPAHVTPIRASIAPKHAAAPTASLP